MKFQGTLLLLLIATLMFCSIVPVIAGDYDRYERIRLMVDQLKQKSNTSDYSVQQEQSTLPSDQSLGSYSLNTTMNALKKSDSFVDVNQDRLRADIYREETHYLIGPGDIVQISVYEIPEFTKSYKVSPDGSISIPIFGRINITDLTQEEAAKRITVKMKSMFQNPQVVVIVEEYNNNYVYILGRVGNPGKHVFDSKPSLLELITLAQGVQSVNPSTSANAGLVNYTESYEKAIIFRGKDQIIEVDLDKLLRDGNMKLNIPLHTRDIVFVPKTDKRIYILGEIETPGMYPYERDMTLLQAVSIAGNSNTNSNLKRVRVIRGDPANPTLLHRNVASALNGSRYVPLKLQPGDIVYVPKKGSEKFKFTVQWINTAIGTILTGDSLVKLIEGR